MLELILRNITGSVIIITLFNYLLAHILQLYWFKHLHLCQHNMSRLFLSTLFSISTYLLVGIERSLLTQLVYWSEGESIDENYLTDLYRNNNRKLFF